MPHALHPPKIKIVTGSPEGVVFREGWARLQRPFISAFQHWRTWWLLHRGVSYAQRWWSPFRTMLEVALLSLLTLALAAWVGYGILVTFFNDKNSWPDIDCPNNGVSCGVVIDVATPVLLVATSTVLFLAVQLRRARRLCTRQAQMDPSRFMETAGSLMNEVVGRDQLCNTLMNNLRNSKIRRPQVVCGKVGTGKTAVLVRLAAKLAAKGAVPIPVLLKDAQSELDFTTLARQSFEDIVQPVVRSEGAVDRIWRWLRQRSDRIVVLADGLEETLIHDDRVRGQRDILIREAIARADEERLPLVIASRPYDPLRAMQAAISELEPLNDEAAFRYIVSRGTWRSDPMLLDNLVEVTKMSESPLYLQIATDLHSNDLLELLLWRGDEGAADVMSHDSWALRAALLESWMDALVDGEFHPELPIGRDMRLAVVEYLSALACIGLASDRADVGLWELDPSVSTNRNSKPESGGRMAQPPTSAKWNRFVAMKLDGRLIKLRWSRDPQRRAVPVTSPRIDVRLAATWGRRMGLVDEDGEKVHFQHSLVQAYLGSRLLPEVGDLSPNQKTAEHHLVTALAECGREFLIALTLHSRSLAGVSGGWSKREADIRAERVQCKLLVERAETLLAQAEQAEDMEDRWTLASSAGGGLDDRGSPRLRALEILGTAVDIDSVAAVPQQHTLMEKIKNEWDRLGQGEDPVRLREAKLTLVKQCGAAARRVAADTTGNPAYRQLFDIGCCEPDYRVHADIAQEIGAGGEQAYRAVHDRLLKPRFTAQTESRKRAERTPQEKAEGWSLGTMAQRRERLRDRERLQRQQAELEALAEKQSWHGDTMRAWILPMLVDSTMMNRHHSTPRDDLERWVRIATGDSESPAATATPGTDIGLGVALAEGFRYAANRRTGSQSDEQARKFLVKQAEELLKRSAFWYTRLMLLQALTLWALPDDASEDMPIRGHRSAPQGLVKEWLTMGEGKNKEHPLVRAAGDLAVRALQTRCPERFLWIDEAATVDRMGTDVDFPRMRRAHHVWIPPSTGWRVLDPMAQQLLADVLLLVVLRERGYRLRDLFHILDRSSREFTEIPYCMIRHRARLDPVRGVEHTLQPGVNCTDACRLRLCPYPAKVENLRMEFSEVFCLQQRDLLRRWQPRMWLGLRFRREAPWQRKVPVAGMRRFWDQMGQRARDVNPVGVDTARKRVRS